MLAPAGPRSKRLFSSFFLFRGISFLLPSISYTCLPFCCVLSTNSSATTSPQLFCNATLLQRLRSYSGSRVIPGYSLLKEPLHHLSLVSPPQPGSVSPSTKQVTRYHGVIMAPPAATEHAQNGNFSPIPPSQLNRADELEHVSSQQPSHYMLGRSLSLAIFSQQVLAPCKLPGIKPHAQSCTTLHNPAQSCTTCTTRTLQLRIPLTTTS